MIDEKKIEEAAEKQIETIQPYSVEERLDRKEPISLYEKKDVLAMFRAGINWFKENLWHDVSEEPKGGYDILIECLNGAYTEYGAYRHSSAQLWNDFVDRSHTTRWLYIEDLMKGDKK